MAEIEGVRLEKIKYRLTGRRLILLLKKKGIKKYEIHKALGISYRTLSNWQAEKSIPSDDLAKEVGKYLGLISPDEEKIIELEKKIEENRKELDRLKGNDIRL